MGVLFFLIGLAASIALWFFWKRRCNEACSESLVLSMLLTIAALPLMTGASAAVLYVVPYTVRFKRVLGFLEGAVLAWWVVTLTGYSN